MVLLTKIVSILFTYLVYKISKQSYSRWNLFFLTPLLISPIVLIILLIATHTSYDSYYSGSKWLSFLLGPATVSFALPMYRQLKLLKKHLFEIIASITAGSAAAIISSFFYALWLQLGPSLTTSLVPRSITTPVAMDISKTIGGVPTLTAVFVIITGITGALVGPLWIRMLKIEKSTAKGLMLGMSAHGAGTSKAFELGELEGTFASIAMIVAALITIILAFTIFPVLQSELLI
ncbi:LrgB family protein [Peribacillus kribbensis]|uniref:LrgB family protein n=1 Tax=Peribacillus kribbensis TaxID=356658 RepID=UPI00040F9678|nr:LrgB family protein [Peribacillus kribbensis]